MITFPSAPQHVLVTGGTGFIGQALIKELLANQHQVTVLSRNVQKAQALFKGKVQAISHLADFKPNTPITAVINLAGARILGKPWTAKQKAVLRASRIQLTQTLIDWMAQQTTKPPVLLSASAIGYYGIQRQGDQTALTETSPPQAIFMSELCQDWEKTALQAQSYGVKVATMRFGVVLGQGGALPMMLLPVKLGVGGRMGTGQQWMSWIHLEDLLQALAHAWSELVNNPNAAKAYNFTAPEVVTQEQFVKTAAGVLKRPSFFPTPAWPVKLLLGEQADLLLEGQKVIPQALTQKGFKFKYPTMRSALEAICG
ncbi:MAG: TIGR01777 family oxidoreductase [Thiofilum sp.]|uniref:TIGR01777 family oxidoreductase n=1 Tax=Thiofilum sp. TaxID=2212733 RepID=UPI0025FFB810|nr:TIGR01777 family oxidoreductase [Thiofilum sp.]MBK8454342.1 TIGR01777 family protein [Thiofilum sp.]